MVLVGDENVIRRETCPITANYD